MDKEYEHIPRFTQQHLLRKHWAEFEGDKDIRDNMMTAILQSCAFCGYEGCGHKDCPPALDNCPEHELERLGRI